ncbi:MAG: trypsin-like peptidase domain-containing protein [Prolixibacteraceae bacterium]|nr:trypsin-like peptidase domain-containing protein [Prolixibacteraceae bacterium]
MALRNLLIILFFASILSFQGKGQVSYGGTPASFNRLKGATIKLPLIDMVPVSNFDLQLKEVQSKSPFKKQKFAKSFDVDISPENSGAWDLADGMKIWRVAIRSKGAYSLNILFDRAILPTGASIFIYTPDHRILRGAFNANNEQSSGMLPIFPLEGDEIVVEYNEPETASVHGDLHISKVNHGYKNAIGTRPLGEAGTCNMDVYCAGSAVVSKEKQAVVQLVIAGTDLCTGTLVNNTKRDKTPYLITAGHCITSATDAQTTVYSFNYESPFCGTTSSVNGFADQTMTGSILRARSDSLDFALVELEMIPPPDYRPYYAGWDHSKTIPASTRAIHHPKGDVKKVSVDNESPGIGTYSQSGHAANSFWLIKQWDIGTTEAGSSGGPLFSHENLVIGSLTGGTATCEHSTDDYFSMFAYQWNFSSLITRQLKKWLDPNNTGETKLEAMDPYASGPSCDQFSDVGLNEKYQLVKMPYGKGYISGHNSLRVTSYAQEFNTTDKTTLSAFSVGIARAVTEVNNYNSTVVFQIYGIDAGTGIPGNILKTIKISIKSLNSKTMNFVILDQPLTITGKYFIGYDINYYNISSDTVAVYSAVPRINSDQNRAFCLMGGSWQPFYWIPEFNVKTSLLINAYGCGTTFAPATPGPKPNGDNQFKIYYPTDPSLNLLYLVNSGLEEFGRVDVYDLLGRKIYESQRMLTTTPMELNCSQLESSIYFITVETLTKREVLKVRVIRSK